MKRLLLILFLLPAFATKNANAQGWEWTKRVQSNESGNNCAIDKDGYVYATGGLGVWLYKYDSLGSVVWSIPYTPPPGTESGKGVYGITTDLFGNIYLLGSYDTTFTFGGYTLISPGPQSYYGFIAKISSGGSVEWIKGLGNINAFGGYGTSSITTDNKGRIYLTCPFMGNGVIGSVSLTNAGSSDFLVGKFDSSGSAIWIKSFGGRASEVSSSISVTPSGKIYVDGYFVSPDTLTIGTTTFSDTTTTIFPYNSYGFLAKLDSNGNPIWARGMNGSSLYGLASNSNEDAFITGSYQRHSLTLGANTLPLPPGYSTYGLLAKFDASGNVSWAKAMKGQYVFANSVTFDPCGNVWIFAWMGSQHLVSNDTIDGYVLTPLAINGNPCFVACWSNSGAFYEATPMAGGGGDLGTLVSDKCGNIYVCAVQEECDTMIIGKDTLYLPLPSSLVELEFLTKFNPNFGCGGCYANSVEYQTPKFEIALYPNPTATSLNIISNDKINQITIANLLGQTVYTSEYNREKVQVNVADLPAGIYLVRINGTDVRKFVKE